MKRLVRPFVLERLPDPLNLDLISNFGAAFGKLRTKIDFNLIIRNQSAFPHCMQPSRQWASTSYRLQAKAGCPTVAGRRRRWAARASDMAGLGHVVVNAAIGELTSLETGDLSWKCLASIWIVKSEPCLIL